TPTRTLSAADLAVVLRAAVGLPPLEDGAAVDRTPVTIDAEAWAEWCLAGLPLCAPSSETTEPQEQAGPWVPRIRDAGEAGRRFAANLAIARRGSITRAAAGAETSRRALRETLKRAGTYQPPAYKTRDEQPADLAVQDASADRAVDVLAKLARGMNEALIATAS